MFGQRKKAKAATISTFIGQNTTIRGDVDFGGGMHVEGTIIGNVSCGDVNQQALLVLTEKGRIQGEIKVPSLILNGTVEGDVYTSEQLELGTDAKIKGNVYYNRLEMAVGAQVNGNLVYRAGGKPQLEFKGAAETKGQAEKAVPSGAKPANS